MKAIRWIKKQIAWFISKNVLTAINNGAAYDEVEAIVDKEAE